MDIPKDWNPLQAAYQNVEFNRYVEGPGADLNSELQPGFAARNRRNENPIFQLCFKNVRMEMKGLENLCQAFAKVKNIRKARTGPYYFAEFSTLNDMERCLTGLKDNKQGIIVEVAKHSQKYITGSATPASSRPASSRSDIGMPTVPINTECQTKGVANGPQNVNMPMGQSNLNMQISHPVSASCLDLSKRTFKNNFYTNPPRPLHNYQPLAVLNAGKTPIYTFNVGVNRNPYQEIINQKERLEAMQNMRKSNELSKGKFNVATDTYIKASHFDNNVKIGSCRLCAKPSSSYCQRCKEFYCSFECQKNDWSNHKYVCFKMPELILGDNNNLIQAEKNPPTTNVPRQNAKQAEKNPPTSNVPKQNANQAEKNPTSNGLRQNVIQAKKNSSTSNVPRQNVIQTEKNPSTSNVMNKKMNTTDNKENCKGSFAPTRATKVESSSQNIDGKQSEKPNLSVHNSSSVLTHDENKESLTIPLLEAIEAEMQSSASSNSVAVNNSKGSSSVVPSSEMLKEELLKESSPLPTSSESPKFPVSGSCVAMTAFCKTNLVFIRSLLPKDDKEYIQLLNKISNVGRKSKPITELPIVNDILLSDYQENGDARVLILKAINKDNIIVSFIDFGNVETKKLSELKELVSEYKSLKRHVFPVQLKNVPDIQITAEIKKYLNSFTEDEGIQLKITYASDAKVETSLPEIELTCLSSNENLNNKIIEMSTIKVPTLKDEPVFLKDIEEKIIEPGENVPIYIYDNSLIRFGVLTIIHEKDVLPLQQFNKRIEEYIEKDNSPYTPRESELCLAKYDDSKWYRAQCLEAVGDQHPSLVFIDYGNILPVNVKDIRKYPKELKHPCVTSIAKIFGLSHVLKTESDILSLEAEKKLKELLPLNEKIIADKVTIDIDEEANTVNFVHFTDMLEKLKELKLI